MTQLRFSLVAVALCSLVLTSPLQAKKAEPQTYQTSAVSVPVAFTGDSSIALSLEQIMADPDWLGRQPEGGAGGSAGGIIATTQRRWPPGDPGWCTGTNTAGISTQR